MCACIVRKWPRHSLPVACAMVPFCQVSIMTFLCTEALYILDVTVTQVLVHNSAPVQVIILKFVGKSVTTQYSCRPY